MRVRGEVRLLDGLVGEDEDDDVNQPGEDEEEKSAGLVNEIVADDAEAEDGLEDHHRRDRDGIGEGAAVGLLEKRVNQDRVGDVVEDVRREEGKGPVARGVGEAGGPEMKLAEDPGDGAEEDLCAEGEDEAIDGVPALEARDGEGQLRLSSRAAG